MLIKKRVGGGTPFARKEPYDYDGSHFDEDIKPGDILTILDAGNLEPNKFGGEQLNFKLKTRNGERKTKINQASLNVLHDEYGQESEGWVNKKVKALIHKTVIGGKKVKIAYFVTEDWDLDEYGELQKIGGKKKEKEKEKGKEVNVPTGEGTEYPEEDLGEAFP